MGGLFSSQSSQDATSEAAVMKPVDPVVAKKCAKPVSAKPSPDTPSQKDGTLRRQNVKLAKRAGIFVDQLADAFCQLVAPRGEQQVEDESSTAGEGSSFIYILIPKCVVSFFVTVILYFVPDRVRSLVKSGVGFIKSLTMKDAIQIILLCILVVFGVIHFIQLQQFGTALDQGLAKISKELYNAEDGLLNVLAAIRDSIMVSWNANEEPPGDMVNSKGTGVLKAVTGGVINGTKFVATGTYNLLCWMVVR